MYLVTARDHSSTVRAGGAYPPKNCLLISKNRMSVVRLTLLT